MPTEWPSDAVDEQHSTNEEEDHHQNAIMARINNIVLPAAHRVPTWPASRFCLIAAGPHKSTTGLTDDDDPL